MAIRPTKYFLTDFIYYFARSSFRSVSEAATATTVPGGKKVDIERLIIPKPSLDIQEQIVTHLNIIQAKVDELKRLQAETQEELAALMPSILDRAFKGEL